MIAKTNLILIGFMGTGKTSVGKLCADYLQWQFVDTDLEIEKIAQTTITELFKSHGEIAFRRVESQVLNDVLASSNQVVSTGGGVILSERNRRILKSASKQGSLVILLTAQPNVLWDRVNKGKGRPLLQIQNPKEQIIRLLSQREDFYQEVADLVIDTSDLSLGDVVKRIIECREKKES